MFDSPFEWATEIRHERNSGDFTRWKQHEVYQNAFDRLLHDLKAEAKKTEEREGRQAMIHELLKRLKFLFSTYAA